MGYTSSKLVEIAKAEIGYHEKNSDANLDTKAASNDGSGNHTKYARDLRKAGYYNGDKCGYAWCDVFVDWCFLKLCGSKAKAEATECQTGPYGAGCGYSMQYYQQQGRLDMTPKVGDQIFFRYSGKSGADHTGIVVEVTSSQVVTVEGNSGNQVKKNTYARGDKTIVGYGHPKYDAEPVEAKKEEAKPSALKSIDEVAREVIAGKWGVGAARMNALTAAGYDYAAVQARVNIILSGKAAKSVTEIAKEVIAGKWGNGSERKRKLTQAGYDYAAVQKRVNELCK